MKQPLSPLMFLAVTVAATGAVFAAARTTDGSAAGLSPAQKTRVRRSGLTVVVPTYVPAGFRVKDLGVEPDPKPQMRGFSLRYTKPRSKAYFLIQMASDGLGDPIMQDEKDESVEPTGYVAGRSPLLGKVAIDYYRKRSFRRFHSTWYPLPGKTYPRFAMLIGEGMEPAEGRKIMESLRVFK